MLKNITLGQYFPGDSFIHRLDARTKLLFTVGYIVLIFFIKNMWGYALAGGFVLLCCLLSQIHVKVLLRSLRPLLFIIIFTFVLNIFFTHGEDDQLLFAWKFIRVYSTGIRFALFICIRLVLLIIGTQVLTLTTTPMSLTDGMEALLRPLSKIGLPVHEISMMMTIALRFVPTLLEETDKLIKAQSARGADFSSGNILKRARNMVPLLVPLFVSAFRRADELALAMESRCYRGGVGRTKMKQLHFSALDMCALVSFCMLIAGIMLINQVR